MPISTSMFVASKSLLIFQKAMEVTSHNMANVNTKGYSRQTLELSTGLTYQSAYGPMGTGVNAETITRAYDATVTRNLIDKSGLLAKYETERAAIQQVETIFNESLDTGMNQVLSDFWNAWQDLANNPEGLAERMSMTEKGHAVAKTITHLRTDLDYQLLDLNKQIEQSVQEINTITKEIAVLNKTIVIQESTNFNANDLRDKRDLAVRQLSELLEITYFEDPASGNIYVLTPKGYPLVEEGVSWDLGTSKDFTGNVVINWLHHGGATDEITDTFSDGKLGGLINMRENVLRSIIDDFNEFTAMLIKEINRQHSQGAGLSEITESTGTYEISPFARLETNLVGENNDIEFIARDLGTLGDQVSITYLRSMIPDTSLSVSVTGTDITITLDTNAVGEITTTAKELVDFLHYEQSAQADAARALVSSSVAEGSTGKGEVTALSATNLNRELSNLLKFGDDLTAGSFDIITYDASDKAIFYQINVNPDDTREDLLAQFGTTYTDGVIGVKASITTDVLGREKLKLEADTSIGMHYGFANDTASALMVLGINTYFAGYDTDTIGLNPAVENDYFMLAAGRSNSNGYVPAGSNANALDIADVKDRDFIFSNGPSTISEAYTAIPAGVGSTAHRIYRNVEFNTSLVNQLEEQRDSISAVSLDEELINMIKFQYGYMAASKIISVSDEMLRALVNII